MNAAHVMSNGMFRVIALLAIALITSIAAQPADAQEEPVEGGPAVVDPTSCGHFETQADATEALHSGELPDAENLDPDGDGIACEMRWPVDPDSPPAVYEPTSCGHFATQADAQEAFDSGTLPDPQNLDGDGDGIVCEFRWGEIETDDTSSSPDTGTAEVVALPATGTGAGAASGHGAMLAGILALVSVAGALQLRMRSIR